MDHSHSAYSIKPRLDVIEPFKGESPSDVIPLIIRHLRKPEQLPLSRPVRSDLTQPHLAIAIRVSKFWYTICERLLYQHVITDQFSEWSKGTFPSNSGSRFARTESLRIEYPPRGLDPTMLQLMMDCRLCYRASLWSYVGTEDERAKTVALSRCRQEVTDITGALRMLRQRTMAAVFPRLRTIAVDSIYAREEDFWDRFEDSWESHEDTEPMQACVVLFSDFLASGNLRHLCVRDSTGPLCIKHTTLVKGGGPGGYPVDYTRTCHSNRGADQLSIPFGGHVRWVSDARPSDDMAAVLLSMGRCVGHLCRWRKEWIRQLRSKGQHFPLEDKAGVDIYCSTSQYGPDMFSDELAQYHLDPLPGKLGPNQTFTSRALSQKEQVDMVAKLQTQVQMLFRASGGVADVFRWHLSADTPVCEACGSGVPV